MKQGTLDTRDVAGNLVDELQSNPAAVLCTLVGQANKDACDLINQALKPAAGRTAPLGASSAKAPARQPVPIDRSMGGLLEVQR